MQSLTEKREIFVPLRTYLVSCISCSQWRIQDLPRGRDGPWRAEREPKRGSGGGAPPGGDPLVGSTYQDVSSLKLHTLTLDD